MPGLWKAWKANCRLSPLPTSPLEIASAIPTLPPLRRRRSYLLISIDGGRSLR